MAGKIGIKESKELVKFIIELIKAIDLSMQDGEFSWKDGVNFISTLLSVSEGLTGIEKVPAEIKDLQKEEIHELYNFVKKELVLANPKYEKFVEDALEIGVKLYDLLQLVKTFPEIASK